MEKDSNWWYIFLLHLKVTQQSCLNQDPEARAGTYSKKEINVYCNWQTRL